MSWSKYILPAAGIIGATMLAGPAGAALAGEAAAGTAAAGTAAGTAAGSAAAGSAAAEAAAAAAASGAATTAGAGLGIGGAGGAGIAGGVLDGTGAALAGEGAGSAGAGILGTDAAAAAPGSFFGSEIAAPQAVDASMGYVTEPVVQGGTTAGASTQSATSGMSSLDKIAASQPGYVPNGAGLQAVEASQPGYVADGKALEGLKAGSTLGTAGKAYGRYNQVNTAMGGDQQQAPPPQGRAVFDDQAMNTSALFQGQGQGHMQTQPMQTGPSANALRQIAQQKLRARR